MLKDDFFIRKIWVCFLFIHIYTVSYGNTREECENLLNRSKAQRTEKKYVEALENLFKAKMIAEEKKWDDLEIKILNAMGLVYSDIFDYSKAMDYYIKGYQIAMDKSDENGKMLLLNNIGVLYSAEKNYEKSQEYIKQAYCIAKQLNDTFKIARFATNLAIIAHKTDKTELAENYLKISFNVLKNNPDDLDYLFAQIVKTENYLYKKAYDSAEKLALKLIGQVDNIQIDNVKAQFLLIFSKIYQEKKDFQQAIYFAEKSLNADPKLTTKVEIYEDLAKIYQEKNMLSLALQYKDSVILLNDSLNHLDDLNRTANNQIRFDLLHLENKFLANQEKQRMEHILFMCVFGFFVLLLLVSIWIFRMRLKEQKMSALLNEAKLGKEIETKNRELAAKVLFQSNRNELIKEIIDKLSAAIPNKLLNDNLELAIQQLKMQLKNSTEWEGFLIYFERINSEFLAALKKKHPQLTADEIRFLSYIYIGLSSKEIATLSNITPEHYRQKKHRLAAKLDVDTAVLYSYLVNEI